MVGREHHRPAQADELLLPGDLHLVEDVDERIDERLLQQQTEGAHQRAERPAVDAGVALDVARRRDHALEVGDGRVRLDRGVVDVGAELLFDRAKKVDPPE